MPGLFKTHGGDKGGKRHSLPVVDQAGQAAPPRSSMYDYRWQKSRAWYLKLHPLCVECKKTGKVEASREIDHIIPHRGDQVLFRDVKNWQALCKPCHSRKTATENGGFGNR